MVLIAVPNLSEGTDPEMLRSLRVAVHRGGARVLDVHTDAVHNRSVLTLTGTPEELVDSLSRLGAAAGTTSAANWSAGTACPGTSTNW